MVGWCACCGRAVAAARYGRPVAHSAPEEKTLWTFEAPQRCVECKAKTFAVVIIEGETVLAVCQGHLFDYCLKVSRKLYKMDTVVSRVN